MTQSNFGNCPLPMFVSHRAQHGILCRVCNYLVDEDITMLSIIADLAEGQRTTENFRSRV